MTEGVNHGSWILDIPDCLIVTTTSNVDAVLSKEFNSV